jgi:non-specific serine/threonine protein kinase
LFEERARAVDPRFTLEDGNEATVAELCDRLDRLPLAIELAAARCRALTPRAILARLERRLALLTSSIADLPERHQTLRATIAWSYDLLDEADQRLFRALAVFAGSFSADAAATLVGTPGMDDSRLEAVERLTQLAEKSLLRVDSELSDEPRFSMLESLREFALERLRAAGDEADAARRHAAYYVEVVEQAQPALQGPSESIWMGRLEDDYDNIRAALGWAIADADPSAHELALRMSGGLWRFWWVRGYLHEGARWLAEALKRTDAASPTSRARALHAAGKLARERGFLDEAESLCRQSLSVFREFDDKASIALVLNSLGNIVGDRSDYEAASALYAESLVLRRELGDHSGAALALHNLAASARSAGDLGRARDLDQESLALFRSAGDRWGIAIGLANLARLALLSGDTDEAQQLCGESLRLRQQIGDRQGMIRCLEIAAQIAIAQARAERAARLLGAVEALRIETGIGLPLDERAAHTQHVTTVRASLRETDWTAAWTDGRSMDAQRAIAYALGTGPEPAPPSGAADEVDIGPLSARELEVARLVARGLTNRQIADELIISKWTADNHVGNILRKLDLVGRAQVAAWLAERGLLEGVAAG